MSRNGDPEGGEPQPPGPSSSARVRPGPDPLLVVCRCFSVITSLSSILCIAVNILSAVRSFKNGSDVFDGIFRCYAVVIAFFVVLAETEWGFIIKFWKVRVFSFWERESISLKMICVAVMTRAFPDYSKRQQDIVLLQNIASYLLLAYGVVYVFSFRVMLLKLGCKCCAGYRDSYALACSNVHARKRKLQGNKQLEIWRNWRDEEKNLNKCC
ncbi:magnesium-dependent phosphatase 1-like [Hibiscus syriacus]|uniref:Magnesium-dependent phosphatase 1-like n=1 Tax=Hibiscus syriacus TaxID=106335 RepID=A0A6A3AUP2_HIBSY|nr:magnesium-dependent phosphatase 1-like [Hibiscus syriacus]